MSELCVIELYCLGIVVLSYHQEPRERPVLAQAYVDLTSGTVPLAASVAGGLASSGSGTAVTRGVEHTPSLYLDFFSEPLGHVYDPFV